MYYYREFGKQKVLEYTNPQGEIYILQQVV